MVQYEFTAGAPGEPPVLWPENADLDTNDHYPTLVVFAHPKCPCTRATISELSRVVTQSRGQLDTFIVFIKPDGTPDGWERTDLWDSAAAIPGVHVVADLGSELSEQFRIQTSGSAVMYSPDGRRIFHGGITSTRGHEGANAGTDAILSLISNKSPTQTTTPVFGCALGVCPNSTTRSNTNE